MEVRLTPHKQVVRKGSAEGDSPAAGRRPKAALHSLCLCSWLSPPSQEPSPTAARGRHTHCTDPPTLVAPPSALLWHPSSAHHQMPVLQHDPFRRVIAVSTGEALWVGSYINNLQSKAPSLPGADIFILQGHNAMPLFPLCYGILSPLIIGYLDCRVKSVRKVLMCSC